ncbi:hypothetical protein [Rhabdothermincola salaria]|uniref:hypothetical protein n=1 Tax=Rhabdothermincola salaria TaxID=2903142 RepID=UPI001E54F671|nr:hypothetical protein [Rhabdothermincola salaria]MCD9624321.1 hypothetical protein [Rhabdothermincola salaria]
MYGVVILFVVALVSLLMTRVATVALTATGMPSVSARFQARSALSGVGFTTSEAEKVVSHPARRRIIMALMLAGNIGIVTAVAGLLGSFLNTPDASRGLLRGGLLVAGLAVVYAISKSKWVDTRLASWIGRWLERYTDLDVKDYAALLHISGDYAVKELSVQPGSWLTEATLGELRLRDEGVLVLGIVKPDGTYEGAPGPHSRLVGDETVILYGTTGKVGELAERPSGPVGDTEHERGRLD